MQNLSHISFDAVPCQERRHSLLPKSRVSGARTIPIKKSEPEVDAFLVWLMECAGLQADSYRGTSLTRRLGALQRRLRVPSLQAARTLIENSPGVLPLALDTLLIGVTDFFRDTAVFEFLRKTALPELLRSRPGLQVCAAGASDGRELYSIALLLAEAGVLEQSSLLGVDFRSTAVAEARAGFFTEQGVASLQKELLNRYFERNQSGWRVCPKVRQRTIWRQVNLLTLWEEPHQFDLILFRNVSIYLKEKDANAIWRKLCAQLSTGGLLVTGKAEKPPSALPLVRLSGSIYRKI